MSVEEERSERAGKKKDPLWLRVLQFYVLGMAIFAIAVFPFLPKSAQEATWIRRPIGVVLFAILVFAMPMVFPSPGTDRTRLLCTGCGTESSSPRYCSRCGERVVEIPPESPSFRERLPFAIFFVVVLGIVFILARVSMTTSTR